ncbi:unnamed protein product [Cylicocyclus nassatus]|uniref:Uncharacterized protein n=1 Tax=Cylicocyclus nassatus TaxID=53992 RepID=A0AA36GW60_CYLNA|nr:unnamed protein product [Cylicocyclus nassatus]
MLVALLCLLVTVVYTCDIDVELESQTDGIMHSQFTFHNGTKSKVHHYKKKGDKNKAHIVGGLCNLQPTILKTYKEDPELGSGKQIGETRAFLEGAGMVHYMVHHDAWPRMGMRVGVSCGFGDCGGRG